MVRIAQMLTLLIRNDLGRRNAHEANGDEFEDDVEAVATLADDDDEQEATPRKKSKQVVQDLRGIRWLNHTLSSVFFRPEWR